MDTVLEVDRIVTRFGADTIHDGVSFAVPAGTTHALVGPSGSGKTTAVRLLLGLERPDAGRIVVAGEELQGAPLRSVRRHLQLVYQNPFTSLDPTWRVEHLVREPLDRFGIGDGTERAERVRAALAAVGLGEHLLASGWRSPARWGCGPTSSCSTSPPPRWTSACRRGSSTCCCGCRPTWG